MLCPSDRTPLIPHQRDGIEARSCMQCHGVWFSQSTLESLAKKSPQPATAEPPKRSNASSFVLRRLACPICASSQLQTRMQGGIETSRYRDCGGIWLAKTEVAKILAARKSQPKTASEQPGSTVGTTARSWVPPSEISTSVSSLEATRIV